MLQHSFQEVFQTNHLRPTFSLSLFRAERNEADTKQSLSSLSPAQTEIERQKKRKIKVFQLGFLST